MNSELQIQVAFPIHFQHANGFRLYAFMRLKAYIPEARVGDLREENYGLEGWETARDENAQANEIALVGIRALGAWGRGVELESDVLDLGVILVVDAEPEERSLERDCSPLVFAREEG